MTAIGARRRWSRSRVTVALAICTALAAAAVVLTRGWDLTGQRPTATAGRVVGPTTPVIRQNLVESVTLPGSVGFGPTFPLEVKVPGTVTWLAKAQATIARGEVFARVDDKPVVALIGELPMYRSLALNAIGRDVRQLETNLRALGYRGFAIDDRYAGGTVTAVMRWQHDLGLDQTGAVDVGRVAYLSAPVRVAAALVRPGAGSPAVVLSVSATTRSVTAAVPADSAGWAARGVTVTVTGADGRVTKGTVTGVGTGADGGSGVGTAGSAGSAGSGVGTSGSTTEDPTTAGAGDVPSAVPVTFSVSDPAVLGSRNQTQVQITHTVRQRANVLTVPVAALLALAEGGYGLELVDGNSSRIVAVTTGMFAQGRVEVSAAPLRDGQLVEVPA